MAGVSGASRDQRESAGSACVREGGGTQWVSMVSAGVSGLTTFWMLPASRAWENSPYLKTEPRGHWHWGRAWLLGMPCTPKVSLGRGDGAGSVLPWGTVLPPPRAPPGAPAPLPPLGCSSSHRTHLGAHPPTLGILLLWLVSQLLSSRRWGRAVMGGWRDPPCWGPVVCLWGRRGHSMGTRPHS